MAIVHNRRFHPDRPGSGLVLAVLLISAATILTALAFQFVGGYPPCPLCLQQRYAYYFAIPAALVAWALSGSRPKIARALLLAVALGYFVNAGLGVYHSGVEWKWWEGPQTCSGAPPDLRSGDLSQALKGARVFRCDEAAWRFLGLSFAGWNVITSALLAALALKAGGGIGKAS